MTDARSPQVTEGTRSRAASSLRGLLAGAAVLCAILALGMIAGFAWFVHSVPNHEVKLDRDADGIVVLTGGASRIADAMQLLAAGRGKRLLITGVHRATTSTEIARLMPDFEGLFACCVDLDRSALNTIGNAIEARRWAKGLGFSSLIVVTSNYHMPRAMTELAQQLPDTLLIPFPVVTDRLRTDRWWSDPVVARLLVSEYLKFIAAQLRTRLEPPPDDTDLAGGPRLAL